MHFCPTNFARETPPMARSVLWKSQTETFHGLHTDEQFRMDSDTKTHLPPRLSSDFGNLTLEIFENEIFIRIKK